MRLLAFVLAVTAAMSIGSLSGARADGCPANAHPAYESGGVVHCKCDTGFAAYHGICTDKETVRTQLEIRMRSTEMAIEAVKQTISAERWNVRYKVFSDDFEEVLRAAATARLARDPRMLLPMALKLSVHLGKTLTDCEGNADLKTACDNLRNFKSVLDDTTAQLQKLDSQ
jgi:hypothetical protein